MQNNLKTKLSQISDKIEYIYDLFINHFYISRNFSLFYFKVAKNAE
jgi:hypothetical protein